MLGGKKTWLREVVTRVILALFFVVNVIMPVPIVRAQEVFQLPQPGTMVPLSRSLEPALLKGIRVYPENLFQLDFILDKGEDVSSSEVLQDDSARLVRYFLAALTIPEKDLWVNLSPYEKDRIVPEAFGQTEMGRDLLSQDYILKQITASVINPETPLGREFWDKVYAEANRLYGTSDVPVDTFNKVWIVPEKAVIYENDRSAYVVESRLKVLQEADYLAAAWGDSNSMNDRAAVESARNDLSQKILREVVIPVLEKEVNEGAAFIRLRQVYHSLILAIWFKDKVRVSLFGKAYVDQNKVLGVDIRDKADAEKIWGRYVESFSKGVFNYVREEFDPGQDQMVPRKYVSGGILAEKTRSVLERRHDVGLLAQVSVDNSMLVRAVLEPIDLAKADTLGKNISGLGGNPKGSDSSQVAKIARDVRLNIVDALKAELSSGYNIEAAGTGSIDISSGDFDKGVIINNIFEADDLLKMILYFGNEFYEAGNDASAAPFKVSLDKKRKKLVLFSVDLNPELRTEESLESTIWIGAGPEASLRVMKEIADAIAKGRKAVTIEGVGMDAHKNVVIDLNDLKNTGLMLFDVDGTLLEKKEEDLEPEKGIGIEFVRLLKELPLGILSGHSRVMQTERISDKLKAIMDISRLFLYVNFGRTLVRFDSKGEESMDFLAPPIPKEDIEKIRKVVSGLAVTNFGMNAREINALKKRLNFNGSYADMTAYDSRRFPTRIRFFPWWVTNSFQPDVVTDIELKKIQESSDGYELSEPYFIVKDGVQVTITYFPKDLLLDPDDAQKTLTPGGIDLTADRVRSASSSQRDPISFQDSPEMLERLRNVSGLKPLIMSITPIQSSMYEFLGPQN